MRWLVRLVVVGLLIAAITWFHQFRQQRPSRCDSAAARGVLLCGNGTELETLDCHLATGAPEHKVISALFEGLTAPGAAQPDADAPGAAASWTHENFTRWTFHLQPQGRWSDGPPVTAEDFVYAYERILNPTFAADYAEMLYILKNAAAYNKGELKNFSQVGARAVDSSTLELTLTGPAPYFPSMLKHYSWFPVPRHVVEKHGAKHDRSSRWTLPENIVCNGPFQLAEWRFTHVLRVTRQPFYWDAEQVKLNEIQFFPISSDSTEERAFQDGQLHLTSTVPLQLIPEFRARKDPQFHSDPILACAFYRYNVTRPPFTDKRVRRAISHAIDRSALVEQVLHSGQIPCTGLTPPGCTLEYETAKAINFNPTKAQALLTEAGFPNGKDFPEFEILINTNEAHRILAEAIQAMLRKHLQIQVKILNQDWQVYLETQRQMKFTLCRAGWLGDYPDPMTFLGLWRTGDGNNNTGFSNAEYDRLIQDSMSEPDTQKRLQTLQQAESLLLEEMPILPLYWQTHSYLKQLALQGVKPSVLEHRCYKAWSLRN